MGRDRCQHGTNPLNSQTTTHEAEIRERDALILPVEPGLQNIWGQRMDSKDAKLAESERGVWFFVENVRYLHTPFQ